MGGVSSAPGAVPTTALLLPPRSPPMSGTILLYTLYAQTAKTILVDRLLPGAEFIDCQRVAATRLFERKQSNANRGNNHGFPLRYPTLCVLWSAFRVVEKRFLFNVVATELDLDWKDERTTAVRCHYPLLTYRSNRPF
jgi:hypothetical protein